MAATSEPGIQGALHSIEQGQLAPFVRGGMAAGLILGLSLLYLFVQFRGLGTPTAIDQAQIARNIADGNGFSTQFIRPLAVWQLRQKEKEIPKENFPDFYQSPLNPLVNALPLALVKPWWNMTPTDLIYAGDRMIAFVSTVFFLLSIGIWYLVGLRLFDHKLSLIACGIILLTDMMWQFSLSGLPQMLMMFLFSGAIWLTVFAMQNSERPTRVRASLFGAGGVFGLMVLAHALAVWIFLGWLVFALVYFRPRGVVGHAALAAVLLVTAPWMVRNYLVCGNPFGLAIYSAFVGSGSAEEGYLRSLDGAPALSPSIVFRKFKAGISSQIESIFSLIGMNLAAGAFFLSLLHPFRLPLASRFRWGVVLMWIGAVIGMGIFGLEEGAISINQLHVLFIPLFVLYGLAFLTVLWSRWEMDYPLLRAIFLSAVVFLCSVPLLAALFAGRGILIQWPPYIPPYIAVLGDWFGEDEIIASDMPWAVAWYARRKSLLLPETVRSFNELSDYRDLGRNVTGLYLTPITGNLRLFPDIYKGRYSEWAFLITRPPTVRGFQLSHYTPLPLEGECIIFSDLDRWSKKK